MLYDLSIPKDLNSATVYISKLTKDGAKIEIKKINPRRSLNQNNYLHAILTLYAGEWGLTLDEAKTSVKRLLGYVYVKNNEKFIRKTSDMDSKELTVFIDQFRNHSAHNGLYLPSSDEFSENYTSIMQQVEYIEATQKRYG